MQIKEIINFLEELAPRSLQESYDNTGLLVGNANAEVTKALISLDVTEDVVEEAVAKGCELIISHHPIIFGGLKSFTGKNYVERTVMAAIKNDIALYAIHTNLDNIHTGVNRKIGEKLGVKNMQVLAPKKGLLKKLVVFVPIEKKDAVVEAMFAAGGGKVGEYDECSFQIDGTGTFRGSENSNPTVGEIGVRKYAEEVRVEMILESHKLSKVLAAMIDAHPYEEVAHDIYTLENTHQEIGSGMVGQLSEPMYALDFLKMVKDTFGGTVRYTSLMKDEVQKIAWCGGSGSFLLPQAKASGADVFLTSDFKYHQFFDAENEIIIADIGHYENEQFTKELLYQSIKEKFPNFALLLTETYTNPINYL
ncbi:Nif3-like dinuclear metal center hexameric protein [Owenweeksia hongkongensis]|uniref:Nif3-like dinuclear metal center hexameric protein n=1 Tax=Owenweeksia hongkongensis TaxID=253245 RepID=UPI003A959A0A